jgi:hypothetical protein
MVETNGSELFLFMDFFPRVSCVVQDGSINEPADVLSRLMGPDPSCERHQRE